jgi:hypothetical protein
MITRKEYASVCQEMGRVIDLMETSASLYAPEIRDALLFILNDAANIIARGMINQGVQE